VSQKKAQACDVRCCGLRGLNLGHKTICAHVASYAAHYRASVAIPWAAKAQMFQRVVGQFDFVADALRRVRFDASARSAVVTSARGLFGLRAPGRGLSRQSSST
jgi:hypothetical protein